MGCEDDLLVILHEFTSVVLLKISLGAEQSNAGIRNVITLELVQSGRMIRVVLVRCGEKILSANSSFVGGDPQ